MLNLSKLLNLKGTEVEWVYVKQNEATVGIVMKVRLGPD